MAMTPSLFIDVCTSVRLQVAARYELELTGGAAASTSEFEANSFEISRLAAWLAALPGVPGVLCLVGFVLVDCFTC